MKGITDNERAILVQVIRLTQRGSWARAARHGHRVTLAALHTKGLLKRRAWREGKSVADNAYEYQASDAVMEAVREG